jgi:hypothetical protein
VKSQHRSLGYNAGKMNEQEAYKLLSAEMAAYRELPYDELVSLIGEVSSRVEMGTDSNPYNVDVRVVWRDQKRGHVLVKGMAGIADCGPHGRIDASFVVQKDS